MFRKYLFGLFTFFLGLALGLLLDTFIRSLFGEKLQNPMLQGALIVFIVAVTFFLWRWAENINSRKETARKSSSEAKPESQKP